MRNYNSSKNNCYYIGTPTIEVEGQSMAQTISGTRGHRKVTDHTHWWTEDSPHSLNPETRYYRCGQTGNVSRLMAVIKSLPAVAMVNQRLSFTRT